MLKRCANRGSAAAFIFSAFVGLFLVTGEARATLTLTAPLPYVFQTDNVIFFAAPSSYSANGYTIDTDAGFRPVDPTATVSAGVGAGRDLNSLILFDVYSATSFSPSGTQQLVLSVVTTNNNTKVPIAGAGAVAGTGFVAFCDASTCQANPQDTGQITDFFYAAKLSSVPTASNPIRIGIYLSDLCSSVNRYNTTEASTYCSPVSGSNPPRSVYNAQTPKQIGLTVVMGLAADANSSIDKNTSGVDTATMTVGLSNSHPKLNCPDTPYFPGDTEIQLDTSGFANSETPAVKVDTLLVAASSTGTPDVLKFGANPVFSRVPFGGTQSVTPFTNDVDYKMVVASRDISGIISNSDTGCTYSGIRSANIRGFLKKSNCFIATAAFRSIEASPVAMLRQFRDSVLLNFRLGKAFVHWYYAWSPDAAEWLMLHPTFRAPVLLALAPLEAMVWLILHPLLPGLCLMLLLGGFGVRAWRGGTR